LLTADRAPNRVSLVDRKTTVLASPPVISVVGDADPTYCLTDALATCNGNLDLPELVQNLLRAVTSFSAFLPPFKMSSI